MQTETVSNFVSSPEEEVIEIDFDLVAKLNDLEKKISDLSNELKESKVVVSESGPESVSVSVSGPVSVSVSEEKEVVVDKVGEVTISCPYSTNGSGKCPYLVEMYDAKPIKPLNNGFVCGTEMDDVNYDMCDNGTGACTSSFVEMCPFKKCPYADIIIYIVVFFMMFILYRNLIKLMSIAF